MRVNTPRRRTSRLVKSGSEHSSQRPEISDVLDVPASENYLEEAEECTREFGGWFELLFVGLCCEFGREESQGH